MRVVITEAPGAKPVVINGMTALLLAAQDDASDGRSPCIAHGSRQHVAQLAALILVAVRDRLGKAVFEKVVAHARDAAPDVDDITDSVRTR